MSTITVCDRCKAATTRPTALTIHGPALINVDLCEGCRTSLDAWMHREPM